MKKLIEAIKSNPVRLRIYSLGLLVGAFLVSKNVVTPTDANFAYGVLALILAVETTRAKVSPVQKDEAGEVSDLH